MQNESARVFGRLTLSVAAVALIFFLEGVGCAWMLWLLYLQEKLQPFFPMIFGLILLPISVGISRIHPNSRVFGTIAAWVMLTFYCLTSLLYLANPTMIVLRLWDQELGSWIVWLILGTLIGVSYWQQRVLQSGRTIALFDEIPH